MRNPTRISLALVTGLLAAAGGPALHAGAVPPVPFVDALPNTAGYCNVADTTGSVDYNPAIQFGVGSQAVTWLMTVHFECTGTGIYNGTYDMTIAGSGTESCAAGNGSGTVVSGSKSTGPGTGPITGGTIRFRRAGLHYYISHPANGLDFTVSESGSGVDRAYKANLWLDLPEYLRPHVAAAADVTPIAASPEGDIRLPAASAAVSVAPGPCVDAASLTGHGFLGERNGVLDRIDAEVAALIPAGL